MKGEKLGGFIFIIASISTVHTHIQHAGYIFGSVGSTKDQRIVRIVVVAIFFKRSCISEDFFKLKCSDLK